MDKLKQVQKYQFWILLVVALILPFAGWFMSRSMMAEAATRTTALKSLDGSLVVKPDDPNDDWGKQVAAFNVEQEKQALLAWNALFERQKPFMVWPKNMPDDPAKIGNIHQDIYREDYVEERERVRKIVNPYDEDLGKGLVQYSEELMPNPSEEWKFQPPSAKEIEAAQEDLWLLSAILGCIASVNEGSTSVYDAPIREIVELLLRGGSPKGSTSGGSSGGAKATGQTGTLASAGGAGAAMMKSMATMMGGGGGVSARQDSSSGAINDVKINPTEDLGAERPATPKAGDKTSSTSTTTSTTTSTGAKSVPGIGMMLTPPGGGMMPMGNTTSSSRGGGANVERYCDDTKKEWKTRGFSLELIMDNRRVPDLLVALSNCAGWPINILRVHVADYKDEDLVSGDAGGTAGGMGGAMMRTIMPGTGRGGPGAGQAGVGAPPGIGAVPKSRSERRRDDDDAPVGNNRSPSAVNDRSALDDPNLARVAIVGVIYIFKQPTAVPPAPSAPTTPGASAAVAETPVGPGSESDSAASPDAAESTAESTGDSDDKPETGSADEATDETPESPPAAPETKLEPGVKPAPAGGAAPRSNGSS